jgi:hypothetical protein
MDNEPTSSEDTTGLEAAQPAEETAPEDSSALDAYSRTVVDVVERVGAAVVSVHIGRERRGEIVTAGGGSASSSRPTVTCSPTSTWSRARPGSRSRSSTAIASKRA